MTEQKTPAATVNETTDKDTIPAATDSAVEDPSNEGKIHELEQQIKEKENRYLYLYAEFDNFKKRTAKERAELIKFGWEALARDLLLVADNLERALNHLPDSINNNLSQGLEMVLVQIRSVLEKHGIQPIETIGKMFDPNYHEAVGQEESKLFSGTIIKEHLKGYMLHGRLLRPARVIISSGQTKQGENLTS
ncbi:MAG: nucleotide exchange factor GrpE [Bdellovibrionota bacterium]